MMKPANLIPLIFMALFSCQSGNQQTAEETAPKTMDTGLIIEKKAFGTAPEGTADLYTLKNRNGMEVRVTTYGGIVQGISVPDKNGQFADVVLGFDSLSGYLGEHPFMGAIIGRYGNRIAKGMFTIDGKEYTLPINNKPNSLHGGVQGFDKHLWQGNVIERDDAVGVALTRTSPDMEQGYPGNLKVKVEYLLNNDNELVINYAATTDQKTICNLTNHAYFNLKGEGKGDILGQELTINAKAFTPVDATLIPTGELRPVKGTPFDFTEATAIGARVDADNEQLKHGGGYDHNFVLDRKGEGPVLAATLYDPISGRFMEVLTEEPGIQFYSGNFLDGTLTGKSGQPYNFRDGLCLETQHFPDSPNQEAFPSTILNPGETYQTSTIYRFSVK